MVLYLKMSSYNSCLNKEARDHFIFKLSSIGFQVDVDDPYTDDALMWADDVTQWPS